MKFVRLKRRGGVGWGGVFVCVWGMVVCVVCMVAPILKDHLNTNACVSVIVRANRAERCLCVCVCGGNGGVCCVYGGPHIEGPPQNQCKCLSLRVKSQREAESMAIH